jgi:hypothetical protein
MRLKLRRIAFAALGLAAVSRALVTSEYHFLFLAVGIGCFLVAGTAFSKAGQVATSLRSFCGRRVRVHVWGQPLPDTNDAPFQIESISALGAGLRISLRPVSGGSRSFLKVAQPGLATVEHDGVEIRDARYVSWNGAKLKREMGGNTSALTLMTSPDG